MVYYALEGRQHRGRSFPTAFYDTDSNRTTRTTTRLLDMRQTPLQILKVCSPEKYSMQISQHLVDYQIPNLRNVRWSMLKTCGRAAAWHETTAATHHCTPSRVAIRAERERHTGKIYTVSALRTRALHSRQVTHVQELYCAQHDKPSTLSVLQPTRLMRHLSLALALSVSHHTIFEVHRVHMIIDCGHPF